MAASFSAAPETETELTEFVTIICQETDEPYVNQFVEESKEVESVAADQTSGDNTTKWTSKAIVSLIRFRGDMDNVFDNPPCRKNKLWDKVAIKMASNGFSYSGIMCDKKWRNLLSTYRSIKYTNKKGGTSRMNWEYYNAMDEILGAKPSADPPPKNYLLNSIRSSSSPLAQDEASSSNEESSPCSDVHSGGLGFRPKRKASDEPPEWFQRYLEKRDKEKRIERSEIAKREKEKVDAIHRLTSAILALVNKKK